MRTSVRTSLLGRLVAVSPPGLLDSELVPPAAAAWWWDGVWGDTSRLQSLPMCLGGFSLKAGSLMVPIA